MKPIAEEQETLYWVNEQDEILGEVDRKKIHDQNLIHREVALLIYDEHQRVLFQKRSLKKRSNPGVWSTSVAGHIRFGQEPMAEMLKEAKEEVGLVGYDLTFVDKELIKANEQFIRYRFQVQTPYDYVFDINPEEVERVEFWSASELEKRIKQQEKINPIFIKEVMKFWKEKL